MTVHLSTERSNTILLAVLVQIAVNSIIHLDRETLGVNRLNRRVRDGFYGCHGSRWKVEDSDGVLGTRLVEIEVQGVGMVGGEGASGGEREDGICSRSGIGY